MSSSIYINQLCAVLALLIWLAGVPVCANESSVSVTESPDRVTAQVMSAELSSELVKKGGVFIFYDPSCPICAEYFPTIERLESKYGKQSPFYFVLSSGGAAVANKFIDDYHPHCSVLIDNKSQLQLKLGARVTPQVFLVNGSKTEYSGRIDDRYVSIGNRRNVIRSNDLDMALAAVSQGKSPEPKTTTPIGCFLQLDQ